MASVAEISHITLMGRLAYILMCVETYLVNVYPDRDWRLLAKVFWMFPGMCTSDWMFLYGDLTPDVILHDGKYKWYMDGLITQEEYESIKQLYHGITEGNCDDPKDELSIVLNIPVDLACEYDGAMSDGNSDHTRVWASNYSIHQIQAIEKILSDHHVELPDIHKLDHLALEENPSTEDMWGERFDGESLSMILKPEYTMSEEERNILERFLPFIRGRKLAHFFWENDTVLMVEYHGEYVGNNGCAEDDPNFERYRVCSVVVKRIVYFDPRDGLNLEELQACERDPEHRFLEIHYHNAPMRTWFAQISDDSKSEGQEQAESSTTCTEEA